MSDGAGSTRVGDPSVDAKVKAICRIWTERADPEKIILFGSAARGETECASDLDFLVVWRGDELPDNIERAAYLRKMLLGKVRGAVDILVLTPEQFHLATADPRTFTSMIVREGEVVYERIA